MKKIAAINLFLALALLAGSCATNNNVVSNRLITKRKHTKGFHINKGSHMKSDKVEDQADQLAEGTSNRKEDKKQLRTSKDERNTAVNTISSKEETAQLGQERTVEFSSTQDRATQRTTTSDNFSDEVETNTIEASTVRSASMEEATATRSSAKKLKNNAAGESGVMLVLLVILALILAPLAVFIYEGATNRFWITLVLWLVGIGLGFWLLGPGIAWACGLAATIYALLIILGVI